MLTTQLLEMASKRRTERTRMVSGQVTNAMQRRQQVLAELDDPEVALAPAAEVRTMLENLRCYQPEPTDASVKLAADVEVWTATMRRAVENEKQCRATPRCMDERAAKPVCDAIEMRRSAVQDIARERSNPGGAVDLHFLHQLGQNIQDADAQLPGLRAEYKAIRKKPLSDELRRKR